MKKFKKVLLSILSLALVAILSIGGTLAYLKSEDSDVNVMTMGNVKIAQHEYERAIDENGNYKTDTIDNQTSYVLKDFTQDKLLLPIVGDPSTGEAGWDNTIVRMTQKGSYGSMQVFAGKVAQDKFVTVENTGKNEAYIRTLVAIEVGSSDASLVGVSYHQTWTKNEIGTFEANGTRYSLIEFTYNGGELSDGTWRHKGGVLPAGDTSYPSLSQVYLKSETENEDVEAIDGNGNGRLDILVLSQAVQTSGFDNAKTALDRAFGEVTVQNAIEWFTGMKIEIISDFAEFTDGEGVTKVTLNTDSIIELKEDASSTYIQNNGKNITINGNGNVLTSGDSANYGLIAHGGKTLVSDVDFVSNGGGIGITGGELEFNGNELALNATTTNPRYNFYVIGDGTKVTINDGEFSFITTYKRAYIYAENGTTVYVKGGTFGAASTRDGYTAGILGEGTVIITGGTFGFDPSAWVASGYVATKTGSTWTVDKA